MDAGGYCVQTLKVVKQTTDGQKAAATIDVLAGLTASAAALGRTVIKADDPAHPHVCKVDPPTPEQIARQASLDRLAALRTIGWAKLTPDQQTEATALRFDLGL